MNIVMFSKGNTDYLHDMLYHGFRQLGHTVVDYPRKANLHSGATGLLDFSWDAQEISRGSADILLICAQPADYPEDFGYSEKLNEALLTYGPKKVAIVDGHDVQVPYQELNHPYSAIFKREYLKSDPDAEGMFNLPLVSREETLVLAPYKEKDIDFLFMGSYSGQPFRAKVLQSLTYYAHRLGSNAVVSLNPCPREEYLSLARRSKVIISVRGYGWDCYRYWETPALGTLMLTEEVPLRLENDFVDGIDCRKFKTGDVGDMERVLTEILSSGPAQLENMALHAWYKTKQYHTPVHRAQYILEKLK